MADQTYNGWTNYETWLVNLWIDNSEGEQQYWHDRAAWCLKHQPEEGDAVHGLRETLRGEFDCSSYFSLRAALSEVNWHEIAQHYIDSIVEEECGGGICDARLIAAAPELLAACKYLLENAEAAGWSEFMLSDAKAAISKAEGRGE
jgi:hypothetical protein